MTEDPYYDVSSKSRVFWVTLFGREGNDLSQPPPREVETQHVRHLSALMDKGTLLSCGIFAALDRGFQLLRARSPDEAERLVREDPLIRSGFYTDYSVEELLSPNPWERPAAASVPS